MIAVSPLGRVKSTWYEDAPLTKNAKQMPS
jgi:hypothetical protein